MDDFIFVIFLLYVLKEMTETTEFVYKRTPRGLVLDPITVQVQPPQKVVHEVDEVKFLNQNPDSIGPPIEDPRSYVGLEASTQMPLGNTYTLQLPVAQGNAGQVLENDGTGQLEWKVGGGSGDVVYTGVNPVPTTRQFAVYDGTTGTEIKDSGYTAPAPASGIVGDVLTLNTPTDAVWSAPTVGGNVTGIPPSLPGNLPQFDNLVADQISDSGVKASELILNPSGVPLVGGTLAQFDTGPTTITDSGIPVASIGTVTSVSTTATVVDGVSFTATPNPITASGSISLGGSVAVDNSNWIPGGSDLAIVNGGSGESTAQLAINALTDVASAGAGEVLTESGGDAVWAASGVDPNAVLSTSTFGVDNRLLRSDGTGRNCKTGANAVLRDTPTVRITVPEVSTDTLFASNLGVGVGGGNGIIAFAGDLNLQLTVGQVATVNTKLETPLIKLSTGAGTGKILTSDAVGDATWEDPPAAASFGQMYFNGNTGTVTPISAINTWATVAGPGGYSSTPSPDFTYTTVGNVTTMEYTGTDTIRVSCGAAFCWESDSGTSDDATIAIHLDTGGGFVPVQASIQNSKLDNNNFGYPRNGSCRCIFSLSTGHSVAIRVQNNNNTDDILVLSLSIDCYEI